METIAGDGLGSLGPQAGETLYYPETQSLTELHPNL